MKKQLEQNKEITANSKQIELLKKNFPQCFDKNGAFIADKMKELMGNEGIELSKESYSLNWLGKSYARLLANENARTLLHEDVKHNQREENKNSQNLLIKGDNLEVLKHLVNAYTDKVKMIYIDPPYNTGSDGFVYQDDRKFTPEQLMTLAGVDLDDAKRILDFTQRKANSHSAWLTFMYPRLYIARKLLKDEGVIFISIDDNEQAQLKLLCDEVFGEENFISSSSVLSNPRGRQSDKFMASVHDSLLIYSKSSSQTSLNGLALTDEQRKDFDLKDDNGEHYRLLGLRQRGAASKRSDRPDMFFPIYVCPETNSVDLIFKEGWHEVVPKKSDGSDSRWMWGKDKCQNDLPLLVAKMIKKRNEFDIFVKDFIVRDGQDRTRKHRTIWDSKKFNNQVGTVEVKKLLGFDASLTPKSKELLKVICSMGLNSCDIVVDFFAGSGTTAHAILQLNLENNGDCKHISVQIDEPTFAKSDAYKAGYKTIFDITKARIEKAADKIRQENPGYKGDLGFKLFETTPVFDGYLDDMEALDPQRELFDGTTLSSNDLKNLLTTWKAYDGFEWTDEGVWVELANYSAYYIDDTLYCLQSGFNTADLKALLLKVEEDKAFSPAKMILFGYNFDSKAQREIVEAMRHYKNKKAIEIDCEVRH